MYAGQYVFTQVTDYLPWHVFRQCVTRYDGEHQVKSFTCSDQFRSLIFAQLTWRESLRDIEACLRVQADKLYHMGFRCKQVSRNTMAHANAGRDWRIYADFAQHLIRMARELYAGDTLPGIEDLKTVYALDSTTIDLCLSVFPWAPFRSTKAAVKACPRESGDAHTARLAWEHPVVHLHQRRKDARCEHPRSSRAGSWRVLRHGSRLCRF